MNRLDMEQNHRWHVALNQANDRRHDRHWMYEAKNAAGEVPRLTLLFKMEREGRLTKVHRQCSHSPSEPVIDNHLSCCLGIACRACEHLADVAKAELPPETIDEIKAWTCATHILTELGARPNEIDTSEGFLLTTDDRIYWDRVYSSLRGGDPGDDMEATP